MIDLDEKTPETTRFSRQSQWLLAAVLMLATMLGAVAFTTLNLGTKATAGNARPVAYMVTLKASSNDGDSNLIITESGIHPRNPYGVALAVEKPRTVVVFVASLRGETVSCGIDVNGETVAHEEGSGVGGTATCVWTGPIE